MSKRSKPPFRADHVGSLLRSAPLKEARKMHASGAFDTVTLNSVEDQEIELVVKKQKEIGLDAVTDGKFRRSWWHLDFFCGVSKALPRSTWDQGLHSLARRPGLKDWNVSRNPSPGIEDHHEFRP